MKIDKILFLGNSITFHPAAPEDGFMNTCGMAATSEEKDYVHILLNRFSELQNGVVPKSIIRNIADFERQHQTMDIDAFFKEELEFKADMLILAIGENVAPLETEELQAAYLKAVKYLLSIIKQSGCSNIVVRGCFWKDDVKDAIMREACLEAGGIYVSTSHLSENECNFARSEREYKHEGLAAHPGDRGMLAIADTIWDAIKPSL